MNLINKQIENKKEDKTEDKTEDKNKNPDKNKENLIIGKDESLEDIGSEDQQNLIGLAEKIHKLKELSNKDKTEDLLQQEKELKERYKLIILKYLYKQKQKELVKKKINI